jgi:hypothetical protein
VIRRLFNVLAITDVLFYPRTPRQFIYGVGGCIVAYLVIRYILLKPALYLIIRCVVGWKETKRMKKPPTSAVKGTSEPTKMSG